MSEPLTILASAISDVGAWSWWTASLPELIQLEFTGCQLRRQGIGEAGDVSQIALRFQQPSMACFLSRGSDLRLDWPEALQADTLGPQAISFERFALDVRPVCAAIVDEALSVRPLIGVDARSFAWASTSRVLAFWAGNVGFAVAAHDMQVIDSNGPVPLPQIAELHANWWDYWRDYWHRRGTNDPMPYDGACEVTIPIEAKSRGTAAP